MRSKLTTVVIVITGAIVALLAGPRGPLGGFWRPAIDAHPEPWQLAGLMTAGLAEAIGFGLGLAVLLRGRPLLARLTATPARATTAQIAAAWLLGSWWPHSALHLHYGSTLSALAGIELIFHAGSVVAAVLLLWTLASRRTTATVEVTSRGSIRDELS